MDGLRWHQYLDIVLMIISTGFIIVGIVWQNGVQIYVGTVLLASSIWAYRKAGKPKGKRQRKITNSNKLDFRGEE